MPYGPRCRAAGKIESKHIQRRWMRIHADARRWCGRLEVSACICVPLGAKCFLPPRRHETCDLEAICVIAFYATRHWSGVSMPMAAAAHACGIASLSKLMAAAAHACRNACLPQRMPAAALACRCVGLPPRSPGAALARRRTCLAQCSLGAALACRIAACRGARAASSRRPPCLRHEPLSLAQLRDAAAGREIQIHAGDAQPIRHRHVRDPLPHGLGLGTAPLPGQRLARHVGTSAALKIGRHGIGLHEAARADSGMCVRVARVSRSTNRSGGASLWLAPCAGMTS